MDPAELVVEEAEARGARLVGITGGVAAGKSTLAAAVAPRLGSAVVATDGFLLPNAELEARDLAARKGFPESYDAPALVAFLDRWSATRAAEAPVYSHLAYDVAPDPVPVTADRMVLEGLHLAHPRLAVRDRFHLLVHVDADVDLLADWYLERFRELRRAAADDPTAFLHAFRELPGEDLDRMAMDVWTAVNVVVLEQEVRPWATAADLVLRLGPDHAVLDVERP